MRLLLDESLPRGLKRDLAAHEVVTVPEQGWAGKDNGELLGLADKQFDVFVTADQGIEYQQNLAGFGLAVVTLALAGWHNGGLAGALALGSLGALVCGVMYVAM